MKRLIIIATNAIIFSLIPILCWFGLGILVDKNLVNVFSITYPLQFIYSFIKSLFGTGANICKEKNQNSNETLSGMTLGIIFGFFVFGLFLLNVKSYLSFMNVDYEIYKEFTVYSIILLYIHSIFALVLEKLYFEGKEKIASKYCIQVNCLNFLVLMISALIFKNKWCIVLVTLLITFVYILFVTCKQYQKFHLEFHIGQYIRYNSVELVDNILFFLIFFFGISNASSFGTEYMAALNFVALITDCQWDFFDAIQTVANIDISQEKFNYKEHIKNAYKLLMILLSSVFLMFIFLYHYYSLNMKLVFIYFVFELVNFMIYPIYRIHTCYLQLEYSSMKTTVNKIIASVFRFILSLLPTPFCTGIGQVYSSIYQFISTNVMFGKNYKVDNLGNITLKGGEELL